MGLPVSRPNNNSGDNNNSNTAANNSPAQNSSRNSESSPKTTGKTVGLAAALKRNLTNDKNKKQSSKDESNNENGFSLPDFNKISPEAAAEQAKQKNNEILSKIDFYNVSLNTINIVEYGVNIQLLPIFQKESGEVSSPSHRRELRLVKNDGSERGPIVMDPKNGILFRMQPPSEYAGRDPVLTIHDFNSNDLNDEASQLLGHLQITPKNEKDSIEQEKRKLAAEQRAREIDERMNNNG